MGEIKNRAASINYLFIVRNGRAVNYGLVGSKYNYHLSTLFEILTNFLNIFNAPLFHIYLWNFIR